MIRDRTTGTPLNLAVVSTTLSVGGAQRFTSTLLRFLDRSSISPELYLLRHDVGYSLPTDVPVESIRYHGPLTFFRSANRLAKLIDARKPDIVLSVITASSLVTGYALRSSHHQPRWVARVGNSPEHHDGLFRRILGRIVYPRVDRFVVNAKALAPAMTRCYGISGDRISAVANPVDFGQIDELASATPSHRRSDEGHLLIAVGRLHRQKRYDVLLEALAILRKNMRVRLWVCGEGPLENQLARHARRLDVDDAVDWLGFCDNPFALMCQADVFVMTSDHEGLPNALIEAQGLGLPAVSTRCPYGPDEIILDGDTGSLVPVGNPQKVADAIRSLLIDENKAVSTGHRAKEVIRDRFDVTRRVSEWEGVIERIAADQPAPEAIP